MVSNELTLMLLGFGRLFIECLGRAAPDLRIIGGDIRDDRLASLLASEHPDVIGIDVGSTTVKMTTAGRPCTRASARCRSATVSTRGWRTVANG